VIKRIAVDNVKCFSNFEFAPANINLLLGANGSGKSTLIEIVSQVIRLMIDGSEVAEVFGEQSRTRWEKRTVQRVEFDIEVGGMLYAYTLRVEDSKIQSERVIHEGRTLFSFQDGEVQLHNNEGQPGATFAFRGTRSFLAQIEDRVETKDLMKFLNFLTGVWHLSLDARQASSFSEQEDRFLASSGHNFPSWYRHLTQQYPERMDELRDDLKKVIPGFRTLKLESTGVRAARELVALLTASGNQYSVGYHELSDGQRGLILLYTILHGMDRSACILLDEPEAHVGLSEVQPWLVRLDERFESQGQVFIISHHPEVIDYLAAGSAWLFERPDGAATRPPKPLLCDRESGLSASQQISRGLFRG
jgi:predicted ATPase